jgi:hypothetical protein
LLGGCGEHVWELLERLLETIHMFTFEFFDKRAVAGSPRSKIVVTLEQPSWAGDTGICIVRCDEGGEAHSVAIYGTDPLHALLCGVKFVASRYGSSDDVSSTHGWANGINFVQ